MNNWRTRLLVISLVVIGLLVVFFIVYQINQPETENDPQIAAASNDSQVSQPVVTAVSPENSSSAQNATAEAAPATVVSTPAPEPSATPLPMETPAPTETLPPTPSPTATQLPTATPAPTETPTVTPSPTPTPLPEPDWLAYLNSFRSAANMARVIEAPEWSLGSQLHSRYMVETDEVKHAEDPNNPFYTAAGAAASGGNLAAGYTTTSNFKWAIEYWMSSPFHGLLLLDPALEMVGFGEYTADKGLIKMGATLDMRGENHSPVHEGVYPVFSPPPDGQTWVIKHSLPEFPSAWTSCSGFPSEYFKDGSVSGPPIILQLGSGDLEPKVNASSLSNNGDDLDHCVFTETTYVNENQGLQWTGRNILAQRDAVIMMPRSPLVVGNTYTVSLTVDGETYTWNFEAVNRPK